jgi:hypothetical protein
MMETAWHEFLTMMMWQIEVQVHAGAYGPAGSLPDRKAIPE